MELIRNWLTRHFSNPQVVGLGLLLVVGFLVIMWMGSYLTPVIAGVIVAYLLEGPVGFLERNRSPRLLAVIVIFCLFMAFVLLFLFGAMPLIWRQTTALFQQFPIMLVKGQDTLLSLPEQYPHLFSEEQVRELIFTMRSRVGGFGEQVLSMSLASVVGALTVLVYLILLPLMVFFFLKDKIRIQQWFTAFLPTERRLTVEVWREVDVQIGNYVRGKAIEILFVWLSSFVTFQFLGLNFAMLLSVLVGLSVLIPYVGAVVVTIPVALIAFFQWGLTSEFYWLLGMYLLIQFLDGNLLVPLLFSEVVNLHPVAIIVSVLVFGGLWGFWGVFFAIPLATLVQAILRAWPNFDEQDEEHDDALMVNVGSTAKD